MKLTETKLRKIIREELEEYHSNQSTAHNTPFRDGDSVRVVGGAYQGMKGEVLFAGTDVSDVVLNDSGQKVEIENEDLMWIGEQRRRVNESMARTPNFNRLGRWDHWQDYTDLYNISYRRFHDGEGFDEVYYNEPSNIVLIRPKDGTFSEDVPVAMFGVKRARGIYEDLRHIDSTGYGVKPVRLSEDEWDIFMENTYRGVQETNPIYLMNFGLMDYTMDMDDMDKEEYNFKKMLPRNLSYNASGS